MFRNSRNAPFHIKCCYTLGLSRNGTPLRRGIPPPNASMELRRIKALLGGSPIPIIVTAALSQSSLARRTFGVASGRCRSFLLSTSPSGANLCGYINKTAGKRNKKKKRRMGAIRIESDFVYSFKSVPFINFAGRPSTTLVFCPPEQSVVSK